MNWTALAASLTSLLVAVATAWLSRRSQRDLEELRAQYSESQSERDARRDYEYEARKRLYHECGPALFQLGELAEGAYYRVLSLAQRAKEGNLEPGTTSFLRNDFYLLSTLYRLLAPSAALKLLQQRLTLVDLSLDVAMHRQYRLMRLAFFAFGDEFRFAKSDPRPLPYEPFHPNAHHLAISSPAVYYRQGMPIGVIESAIEALLLSEDSRTVRVISYAECEANYESGGRVRSSFDAIKFLFEDFHPRDRPVLWRILILQACVYHALCRPADLSRPDWTGSLTLSAKEAAKFDWRGFKDSRVDEDDVLVPFSAAQSYLEERILQQLETIDGAYVQPQVRLRP